MVPLVPFKVQNLKKIQKNQQFLYWSVKRKFVINNYTFVGGPVKTDSSSMGFSLYSLHQYSLTNIVMKNHQAEYDFKFVNFPNWFHSLSQMGRVWLWLNQSNIEYRMNKCQISNEKCRILYYYLEQKTFDEKSRISHSTFHKINSLFLRFYNNGSS